MKQLSGSNYFKRRVSRCYNLEIKELRKCVKIFPIGNERESSFLGSGNMFGTLFPSFDNFSQCSNSLGVFISNGVFLGAIFIELRHYAQGSKKRKVAV